jgi:hypothetical protein
MQQRQPRLGDILDDYCPRERRITNHAVVAMVGEEIKQTRCTTCDSDHEYKHAKVPVTRKKKDTMSAAFSEVLASVQQDAPVGVMRPAEPPQDKPTLRFDEPQVPDSPPAPPAGTLVPSARQRARCRSSRCTSRPHAAGASGRRAGTGRLRAAARRLTAGLPDRSLTEVAARAGSGRIRVLPATRMAAPTRRGPAGSAPGSRNK